MNNHFLDPDDWIKIFIGIALVGAGLLALYFLGQTSTLACSRLENQAGCTMTTTWMGLYELREAKFYPLTAANVEENCDDDGCTYRVVLSTRSDSLPLTSSYSSGYQGKKDLADQINAFVQDDQQDLLEVDDGEQLWVILPIIFMIVGIGMVIHVFYKRVIENFHRST